MVVDLDVVVDGDLGELPLAVDEALGGERLEGRPIEPLEELAAALPVGPHRAVIEIFEQLADPLVERVEREEGLVAKPRQDPALHDLHRDLDLGLVPRPRGRAGRIAVP